MRPVTPLACLLLLALLLSPIAFAEDAGELREKGIAALKDSQANPRAIVDAARAFAKAETLYVAANNEEKAVEMNSFLYWCKKKMNMADIEAFTKGGESAVAEKIEALEKLAPKADESQKWFDRADKFAQSNPNEHLLIAVRFYEVADRFKGSDASLQAQDRSLKELLQEKSSGAKSTLPPVAVRVPDTAPASSGSRPVPGAEELKQADKLIKDLFKAEYAKTDAPSRLALISKLLQQADENKADAASEFVLLHEARDLAVVAGDAALATDAQKRLRDAFKMDFVALLLDLKRLEVGAKIAESAAAMATLLSLGADDALAVENYDQAARFNARAEELLPLLKDAALKARLKAEIPRVQELKRDSVSALAALKTLTTKPDDPEANLIAGKFALKRGQFEQAFAMLAKSKDAVLSGIAKRELTPSAEAPEQVLLGDAWFDRAEKEPSACLKTRMQERAILWYGNALPALTGLVKVKTERQLKILTPVKTPQQSDKTLATHSINRPLTYNELVGLSFQAYDEDMKKTKTIQLLNNGLWGLNKITAPSHTWSVSAEGYLLIQMTTGPPHPYTLQSDGSFKSPDSPKGPYVTLKKIKE